MLEEFRLLRAKADAAIEECRIVRERIARARRDSPEWPEEVPSEKNR